MHKRFGKAAATALLTVALAASAACGTNTSNSATQNNQANNTAILASASRDGASCQQVHFPVQVLQGRHTLRGTLCQPSNRQPQSALVLVHGSTYHRAYWDFPVNPPRYSAARILARQGHLSLAIDRIGSGESDRPPSEKVTPDVSSDALHQVISQVKSDSEMRTRSGKVFLVGHSSGAVLSIREAAQFDDVDGVVVTGFMHSSGPGNQLFQAMIHPAAQDPKFRNDTSIPSDYTTSRPGVRFIFYYPFNAEERIVRADERTKDAMPGTDSSGFVEELTTGKFARRLDVPVLSIVGTHDLLFCTPPNCPQARNEKSYYTTSPDFQLAIRPRTGHDLNLHRNAPETTDLIGDWADRQSNRS